MRLSEEEVASNATAAITMALTTTEVQPFFDFFEDIEHDDLVLILFAVACSHSGVVNLLAQIGDTDPLALVQKYTLELQQRLRDST
jgi:hypothetical protein